MFDRPPLITDPSGQYQIWRTEPSGLACSLVARTRFTLPMAETFLRAWDESLASLPGPHVVIADWRPMTGYESEARKALTDWGLKNHRALRLTAVVLGHEAPSLVRMGVQAASMVLAVGGMKLDVRFGEIDPLVRELGLRVASGPVRRGGGSSG